MPDLCQYPQEQLTTLTELRELVVHMDRPLQDEKGLRCLPLLVFAHRAQYTPEASLRLSARCILKSSYLAMQYSLETTANLVRLVS